MNDLWMVASRELRERLRSRAFIISTVFTIALVLGIIGVVMLTADEGPPSYRVGVDGAVGDEITGGLRIAAATADVIVDTVPVSSRLAAETALLEGDLDAVLFGSGSILLEEDDEQLEAVLTVALVQAQFIERLVQSGLSPDEIEQVLVPEERIAVEVLNGTAEESDGAIGVAVAGIVLLFIVITTYGQWVLIGVLEEKTNRVVELISAAVPVRVLLTGKVLGIGILGLGQMVLLVAIGLVAATSLDLVDVPDTAASVAAWSLVWFLAGFALYAVIYAAAGSLVSRQEDAQSVALPIAIVALAAYLGTFIIVLPDPESPLSMALTMLPPMAPIAFPARIALDAVAGWEIALGLVVMAATIRAVLTVAARVYTGALLQSGARMRWRQAWRAARDVAGA